MRSNRDLLELAAKSAGIEIEFWVGSIPRLTNGDYWEPLSDDGDAFRLAYDLGLTVSFDECNDISGVRTDIVMAAASLMESVK